MDREMIAQFTVCVSSTEGATWQGTVTAQDESFVFQSEMQLLHWVLEKYPHLKPEVEWKNMRR